MLENSGAGGGEQQAFFIHRTRGCAPSSLRRPSAHGNERASGSCHSLTLQVRGVSRYVTGWLCGHRPVRTRRTISRAEWVLSDPCLTCLQTYWLNHKGETGLTYGAT